MNGAAYLFGDFQLIPSARELRRNDRRVELPRRTFECLDHLIVHRDRAVGRDELVEAVFGRPNVSDAQLGQVILRARRAVDDDGNAQRVIRTIAGYGYRWVAEVHVVERTDPGGTSTPAVSATPPPAVRTPGLAAVPAADTAADPMPSPTRRRTWRALAIATAVAAFVLALVLLDRHARQSPAPVAGRAATTPEGIVVLPMQVDGLREDAWVRLGAMDLIAERLREAGFAVPPSENVLGMLRAGPAASADIDVRPLLQASGAQLIVRGKATRSATGWKVELAAQPAQGIAVPVEFSAGDAIRSARGAADLLLAALGRNLPPEREADIALDETLQRARAAMLANELDTAREILTTSPQLAQAPAQLQYRLAQVDFRAGQLDRAEAALSDVLTQPATQADPQFHGQVLIARGSTHMRRGEFADGGRDFDAAIALLAPTGRSPDLGRALLGRANSRVPEHRFEEALADFGAARIDLESVGDALGIAKVDANLGMLELYRGRPAAALGYLPAAVDRFQAFGALHEFFVSLTGMIDAQLSMLQRDEAAASFERGWALRERITDPDQRVDLMLNRVQVLAGSGRYREASAALAQAKRDSTSGNRVLLARLRSLGAELAWRRRDGREAAEQSKAALADWPVQGADAERSAVVLTRQRALLELGDVVQARGLLERTRTVPEHASEDASVVADAIAMAEWAGHEGDAATADRWFRFASASADRRGVPAEIVLVAAAYAPVLLAAGAYEPAAAAIGRVAPWANRDFDCALLQLRLFRALDQREPWFNALRQAQTLAGEREIPSELMTPQTTDRGGALQLGTTRP